MSGYDGRTFLRYAFLYSLGRFVIEYFRGDKLTFAILGREFSSAMTISGLAMGLSVYLHLKLRQKAQAGGSK